MHSDGASRPNSKNEIHSEVITLKEAVQDIAFGSIAGMVSEVFEYPFDLAKVRLQSQLLSPTGSDGQPRFKGPMDCLMQTWRDEGFRGLYRVGGMYFLSVYILIVCIQGLPVPLVGSMAETAALFVAYTSLQNVIRGYYKSSDMLTIPQLCFAAAGAGAATSFILSVNLFSIIFFFLPTNQSHSTPIELIKCKLQVQMMNVPTPARIPPIHVPITPKPPLKNLPTSSIYASPPILSSTVSGTKPLPGPFSIARNVIVTNGVRGLWLGHTGTVLRESGGTAVWFSIKEWVSRMLRDRREMAEHGSSYLLSPERRPSALLPWESAFSGAISGAVCVAALYPADTVKSAMQTEEELREMRAYQKRASSAAREWSTSSSSIPSLSSSSSTSTPTSKPTIAPKSRHITTVTSSNAESMSFLETFLKIYRTHGVKGLYSGCGMSMARAIPSSGIVFLVYDGLTAWFA